SFCRRNGMRPSGRARLPTCVVRMRWALRFMAYRGLFLHLELHLGFPRFDEPELLGRFPRDVDHCRIRLLHPVVDGDDDALAVVRLVSFTLVPNASVLCDAVSLALSYFSPLASFLPWNLSL